MLTRLSSSSSVLDNPSRFCLYVYQIHFGAFISFLYKCKLPDSVTKYVCCFSLNFHLYSALSQDPSYEKRKKPNTVRCQHFVLFFSIAYVKRSVNHIIFSYKLGWTGIEDKFSTTNNWYHPFHKPRICVNSFCVQRAVLLIWIRITSLKAKIFRSVLRKNGLRHEVGSTVCLVVINWFAIGDRGSWSR